MKTILTILCFAFTTTSALAETPSLSTAVQQGLFEEEVNRDFSAAMRAYESAVADFDRERHLAAIAVFRLAENYRRAGRTPEAEALYERILREFHDIPDLVPLAAERLPEERLIALAARGAEFLENEQEREIARLKEMIENSPDRFYSQVGGAITSLNDAIEKGNTRVVEFILEQGFDVAAPWRSPLPPPLLHAMTHRNLEAVEILVNYGADVNVRGSSETTPLHEAGTWDFPAGAKVLLENGADANARDSSERTPLFDAAAYGYLAVAEVLLENGADVNARDRSEAAPLHFAPGRGHYQVTALLLEYGADVNAALPNGTTALHHAVHHRFPRIVELLLEHGADIDIRDGEGQTPLDLLPDEPTNPIEQRLHGLLTGA